jgi:Ca2+-transporting ATPase
MSELGQEIAIGLSSDEVAASRERHGRNVLTPPPREPWWRLYLGNFEDPVIRILLIAVAISFSIAALRGHGYGEGIGVTFAVLLATGLAFASEHRARKEFDVLNRSSDDAVVPVVRDGVVVEVARQEIVVGDLVILDQGAEIPADGEVLTAVSLLVNESSLSGESVPVEKLPGATASSHEGYPPHRVFRGTIVVSGSGRMRVTAVGDHTEMGRTAREAAEDSGEQSPLDQQLERLSKWIGVLGFSIAAITFVALLGRGYVVGSMAMPAVQWIVLLGCLVALAVVIAPIWVPIYFDFLELRGREAEVPEWLDAGWRTWAGLAVAGIAVGGATVAAVSASSGQPLAAVWLPLDTIKILLDYFMIAVTIVVVAVPEGLALATTLSLAFNMRRMTAQNCLVKKLDATETIGAATHICSDKTGTLTQNEMRVHEAHFRQLGDAEQSAVVLHEACAVNATAHLGPDGEGGVKVIGNPSEGALLLWLREHREVKYDGIRDGAKVVSQLPFSTEYKFMATLLQTSASGANRLHVKGAPDIIIQRCTHIASENGPVLLSDEARAEILAEIAGFQARAMRSLGFAIRDSQTSTDSTSRDLQAMATQLTWLGYVAIADPVRSDVPGAVQLVRAAGIDVKIVTGDNLETAKEIGRQIGLWTSADDAAPQRAMQGTEFGALSEEEAMAKAADLRILARARPTDKLKLVRALETSGAVVAVTGDGTNDAPALNYARVGLAMGKAGTAYAKEASDIIILDDSFASIATAVKWGRSLYLNIQRFILFQLTINVAACGIAMLGPFIGIELPLTVPQMLWVNLIMDSFAALALATEPPDERVMRDRPRSGDDFIVSPAMAKRFVGTGMAFLVVLVTLLKAPWDSGISETERLTIFFSVFVMLQVWNMFNAKAFGTGRSALAGLGANPFFVGIMALIVVGQIAIVNFGGTLFRTTPLSLNTWLMIVIGTMPVLLIGEVARLIGRSSRSTPAAVRG